MELFAGAGGVGAVAYQAKTLGGILTHLVLEDFACGVHGEGLHEFNVPVNLMAGHAGLDVIGHLFHGNAAGLLG